MIPAALPPFPAAPPLPALPEALRAQDIALPSAGMADLPILTELYSASRMPELLLAPWPLAQKRAFLDEQFALQHVHFVRTHRKGDFRLVTRAEKPVGRFYFDRNGREWGAIDLLLGVETQGRGIGGALLAWLQQAAADAGAAGVRLSVAHDNPRAHALYRRLGFADAGDIAGTHIAMTWRP